jgi:hypothetical protein
MALPKANDGHAQHFPQEGRGVQPLVNVHIQEGDDLKLKEGDQ